MFNEGKELIYGREFEEEPVALLRVDEPDMDVAVRGKIIHVCRRDNINGRPSIAFRITDYTDILLVRFFVEPADRPELLKKLKRGTFVSVKGSTDHDPFDVEVGIEDVYGIYLIPEFEPPEEVSYLRRPADG